MPSSSSTDEQRRSVRFASPSDDPKLLLGVADSDSRRSLTDSRRSTSSGGSGGLNAGEKLRSHMMRHHHNKDPLFYYEVLNVLGAGSMGCVAKVKKRDQAVGGSARKEMVASLKKIKKREECFQFPIFGPFFKFCMKLRGEIDDASQHSSNNTDSTRSLNTAISSGSSTSRRSMSNIIYAMKSIHLNRIKDKTFETELKNEIEILKRLDHPHIVRPIETFLHRNQIFVVMECCSG